jgi:hypothetical protein
MIGKLLDKLVFTVALLCSLQLPLLVEHYHQYLSGWYYATEQQVEGYQATAEAHQFASLQAMIEQHLTNADPSVQTDARQKLVTVDLLAELSLGMDIFAKGNLPEKIWYMLQPGRIGQLGAVVQNFKPGIPLILSDLLYAFVLALVLNMLVVLPFRLVNNKKA